MKTPTPSGNSGTLLSLKDVAAWQIAGIRPDNPDVRAALPALQRGAVWRAPQIEDLWDSVVRGFPVGAFLLAPYRQGKGIKPFCVTIDREGPGYLPHLFGPGGFTVVRKPEDLPARLPLLYAQLTGC